ncbi:MAG: class I SAM-dependent methyltransferase, partial [Desulfobacterales bacterium]|nr:class I SAM-dependent methyltransferase [Desulfobacterales bacterium]
MRWKSRHATHCDRHFISKVDFWRDIFPGNFGQSLVSLDVGEKYSEHFDPGELVAPFTLEGVKEINDGQFKRCDENNTIIPTCGRFYPQGYGWRALQCFPQNPAPMRILKYDNGIIVADTNHPLSTYSLTLEARIIEKWSSSEEHGGSCSDIAEIVTSDGPGMQVPYSGVAVDYYSTYPFRRINDSDDRLFYKMPRMVNHIDDVAIEQITSLYGSLLSPNTTILDLMSSWVSHIPPDLKNYEVVGLGLNQQELGANKQLSKT